jgi:hypothetical protein
LGWVKKIDLLRATHALVIFGEIHLFFFFFGVPNDLTLFDFHTGPYPNDGKGMEGCSLMMLAVDCFLEALCFS